jgi:flagellar basal-body rod modification protein FlgD
MSSISDSMLDILVNTGKTGATQSGSDRYNPDNITKKDPGELSFTDMLQLMVAQFQNQTIDNTADTSDMMNQLTQMTSVQAMTAMTTSMESLVKSNTLSYGASLVNKEVTVGVYNEATKEYDELYGKVEAMGMYNGEPVIFIEGKSYPLSNVMAVGKLPEPQEPEEGEGEGEGESEGTPTVPDEDAKG